MIDPAGVSVLPLKLELQFFGKAEREGRTEKATSKKRDEARKEGQVAKSQELAVAFSLLMVFSTIRIAGGYMVNRMNGMYTSILRLIPEVSELFHITTITGLVVFLIGQLLLILLPIFAMAFLTAFVVNYIQVGWKPTTKPLKVKLNKLNPITGLKRLFSISKIFELVKTLAKLFLIGAIIYMDLRRELEMIPVLLQVSLMEGLSYIANLSMVMGIKVGAWYLMIAAADYIFQKYKHEEGIKMTKQQVKDEIKNSEGDPKIKSKIRSKMREISMRRMMQDVPGADVVITNPNHYAVALKYDKDSAAAPVVVAKGVDFLAEKIKKAAREHNVHIVENRHLARTLYSTVEVGQEIPEELFQSVAEILAYVYSIRAA
jgi:flagellar biosynthetic protein FlhB